MGPKKVPEKKKASKGDLSNGLELDPETKMKMYQLTISSLQVQLSERAEESSKAISAKRELQEKMETMAEEFSQARKRTLEIKQDMTRQYTSMQEDLLSKIIQLDKANGELRDLLAEADVRKERIIKEKNAILQIKDEEIAELKSKIDTMSDEFGDMLRETLDKMRERIEVSSGNFEAPEVQVQQKMEELEVAHS